MLMPLPILSSTITVAKDHVIYCNVISLLLCFGHPLMKMDAVLATIVAGGQANIN
jgi:hypothetical protein